jgi:hypothetical protein
VTVVTPHMGVQLILWLLGFREVRSQSTHIMHMCVCVRTWQAHNYCTYLSYTLHTLQTNGALAVEDVDVALLLRAGSLLKVRDCLLRLYKSISIVIDLSGTQERICEPAQRPSRRESLNLSECGSLEGSPSRIPERPNTSSMTKINEDNLDLVCRCVFQC